MEQFLIHAASVTRKSFALLDAELDRCADKDEAGNIVGTRDPALTLAAAALGTRAMQAVATMQLLREEVGGPEGRAPVFYLPDLEEEVAEMRGDGEVLEIAGKGSP